MIKNLLYRLFTFLPLKKNKIIFWGYYGSQYGCSPKYISEYIVSNEPSFDVVWATLDNAMVMDDVKRVKYASLKFWYELATSKFIITNYRFGLDMDKREGQIYIQTWHSSLRLKKIEKDAETYLPPNYIQQAKRDSKKIDYLLSGCQESTRIFRSSFWYDGDILEIGTPRIDPIIESNGHRVETIKQQLGLDKNMKILLYAPTFRKSGDYSCYLDDFDTIINALETKMGGKWKVIVRLHPHLMHRAEEIIKNKNVINGSSFQDIQELLIVADFLITDYSSLMFDFLFSKKPVLLYLPDLKHYLENERELYYKVEDLPFLKAYNREDIVDSVNNFDSNNYLQGLSNFEKKIGSFEKGTASKELVSFLKQRV